MSWFHSQSSQSAANESHEASAAAIDEHE